MMTPAQAVGAIGLSLSLIGSWSYFYSEQKINTEYRVMSSKIIERHAEEIAKLQNNQARIIETVANLTEKNEHIEKELEKIAVNVQKIAVQVGAK